MTRAVEAVEAAEGDDPKRISVRSLLESEEAATYSGVVGVYGQVTEDGRERRAASRVLGGACSERARAPVHLRRRGEEGALSLGDEPIDRVR